MTDAEFNLLMANISPETIKIGTNMAKNNPEMFKQQMNAHKEQMQQQNPANR